MVATAEASAASQALIETKPMTAGQVRGVLTRTPLCHANEVVIILPDGRPLGIDSWFVERLKDGTSRVVFVTKPTE